MAQEWYLMSSPYNHTSGFEDEVFDSGVDNFMEILGTNMACDVEICNYDLSDCKASRAVIQNRTPDTELKTLTRMMLTPIGTCKAGMYVKYKNRYWLIVGLVDNNGIYEKSIISICNWKLTWINDSGKIIERWCNIVSASQYNNGETGMEYYFVRSDQILVTLPDDDECLLIPDRKRFVIDRRCNVYIKSYDNTITKDTSNPLATYQMTRIDSVLYNYGDSGHVEFIATQDEKRDNDGYYVVDGKGYWLCQSPVSETPKPTLLSCEIVSDENVIYNDLDESVFQAVFRDANGAVTKVEPKWRIVCDFANKLSVRYDGDFIYISSNDSSLINKSFELFLSGSNYKETHITVFVRAFF